MSINVTLTKAETGCNIVDSLPIFGALSASVRVVAAKIQMFVGACLLIQGLVGQAVSKNSKKWTNVVLKGHQQLVHGALNALRGLGTLALASSGLNFGLFIFQIIRKEGFAPIVKYNDVAARRPCHVARHHHVAAPAA